MKVKLVTDYSNEILEKLRSLYMSTFPKEERKPFEMMLEKQREGLMELHAIVDEDDEFIGLAIMVLYEGTALLDYFAVEEDKRSRGYGTAALGELQEKYADMRFFLEIESTSEECADKALRKRRKSFYKRNGFGEMDYEVCLFGVNMEVLTHGSKISFEEYYNIYESVFGSRVSGNVSLITE